MKIIHDRLKLFGAASAFAGSLFAAGTLVADEVMLYQMFTTEENSTNYVIATPDANPDPVDTYPDFVVVGHGLNPADPRMRFHEGRVNEPGVLGRGGTIEGEWMWTARRMTTVPGHSGQEFQGEGLSDRDARLKIAFNVEGYGDLRVVLNQCVGASGHEPNDDFYIRIRFDGGDWFEIGGFKSSSSNAYPIYYVGPHDTMTMMDDDRKLTRFFAEWGWDLPGHGSIMEMQLTYSGNAFNEDHYTNNLRIFGNPNAKLFDASFADAESSEPEAGADPVPNYLTITLNEPAPAGGAVMDLIPVDRRSANSVDLPESVTIPEGQTTVEVPAYMIQDNQYTGRKLVDIWVTGEGYSTEIARVRVEDTSSKPILSFMEALNVVPGLNFDDVFGDANNDGYYHNTQDQFLEIVNWGDEPVDMSGYRIGDDLDDRHYITDGTILHPMQPFVVFGGGTPSGTFGGAIVQIASGGGNGLGLNISSRAEFAYLDTPYREQIQLVHIPMQRADHLAITNELDPDHPGYGISSGNHRLEFGPGDPDEEFVFGPETLHVLIEGAEGRLFSPGYWYDGSLYYDAENKITLTIDNLTFPDSAGPNAATGTIVLEDPAPAGGLEVFIDTDGVIMRDDGSFIPRRVDLDSLYVTVPEGATEATFRIGAYDRGVLDGDETINFFARSGPYVYPGWAQVVVEDTFENDYNVVINEIMADVEGQGWDWNLDGEVDDPFGDQYVELVNASGRPVNMSGWHLFWDTGGTFAVPRAVTTFPEGTWVPDGGAIVVFGAITAEAAADPVFGNAIVQNAYMPDGTPKRDGVDLEPTGNWEITLLNQHGAMIHKIHEIPAARSTQDQAITRFPDVTGGPEYPVIFDDPEEMWLHLEAELEMGYFGLDGGSPGRMIDGTPFEGNGQVLTPHIFTRAVESVYAEWLSDPVFGALGMVERHRVDLPWLFSSRAGSYWSVHQDPESAGAYIYDMRLDTWTWTNYSIYPWVYSYEAGDFVNRDTL